MNTMSDTHELKDLTIVLFVANNSTELPSRGQLCPVLACLSASHFMIPAPGGLGVFVISSYMLCVVRRVYM